eukprot:scaffold21644_cov46-Prasinocladus_malaysianus.AAC.2
MSTRASPAMMFTYYRVRESKEIEIHGSFMGVGAYAGLDIATLDDVLLARQGKQARLGHASCSIRLKPSNIQST